MRYVESLHEWEIGKASCSGADVSGHGGQGRGRCRWSQREEPSVAAKELTGKELTGKVSGESDVRVCERPCELWFLCASFTLERCRRRRLSPSDEMYRPLNTGLQCLRVPRGWISLQGRSWQEAAETLLGWRHPQSWRLPLRWHRRGCGISPFSLDYALTAVLRTVNSRRTASSRPSLWGRRSKPGNQSTEDHPEGTRGGGWADQQTGTEVRQENGFSLFPLIHKEGPILWGYGCILGPRFPVNLPSEASVEVRDEMRTASSPPLPPSLRLSSGAKLLLLALEFLSVLPLTQTPPSFTYGTAAVTRLRCGG